MDLFLGIPYQTQRNDLYLAKSCEYKITKEGHTYILTTAKPKSPSTKEQILNVQLNQCVSIYLVRPITPNNTTLPVPKTMNLLLHDFAEVFQPLEGHPPSQQIDHSIHLILDLLYLIPLLTGWPQQT